MKTFIESWATKYDEEKYSTRFYFNLLSKLRKNTNPEELGQSIIYLLHWKDGKVYENSTSNLVVDGYHFKLGQPKPNTYSPDKHYNILVSKKFYDWSQLIIKTNSFSSTHLEALRGSPFALWSKTSIVIPAFVMHVLSPMNYPLYDQHVERAKRGLLAEPLNNDSAELDMNSYESYQNFFIDLASTYAGNDSIEDYKIIDSALWSFGKWLKSISNKSKGQRSVTSSRKEGNTFEPDLDFKEKVLSLIDDGLTQLKSMKKVANERGVILKDSYYRHPGSHVHRWRKQIK